MKDLNVRYGEWALVLGAAEGVGAGFSEALASRGINLFMVDIKEDVLTDFAGHLRSEFGIQARTLALDLGRPGAWRECLDAVDGLDCRLAVVIAAYAPVGPFLGNSHDDLDRFLDLNNRFAVHLVHGFATRLKASGRTGGIIMISSLSGIFAPPLVSVYASTKAFISRLAESLFMELKPHGIDILAATLGITNTPAFRASGPEKPSSFPGVMEPREVAEYALKRIGKRPVCIPGFKNRFSVFFMQHLMPSKASLRVMNRTMYNLYPRFQGR